MALRSKAGLNQAQLGDLMAGYRPGWSRSTVVKLENYNRESLSVADLLALALALDVPPMMLLADPRHIESVPVAKNVTVAAWDALLWLSGTGTITESNLNNYSAAAWLIQAGWTIVEGVADLGRRNRVFDRSKSDQIKRAQERDDEQHRAALEAIRAAMIRIVGAKAPLPPMFPKDLVYRRAAELEVELPRLDG